MVTESYVSFEIAKLLKEKGFDEATFHDYDENGICWFEEVLVNHNSQGGVACPTLQMAMKWLRENYCLYIDIELLSGPSFSWYIWFMNDPKHMMGCSEDIRHYYDAYEEACEAAIKYCLENLI